jgi:hypothetical protein
MNSFMLTQKGVQWAFDRVESMRDYAHREGVLKRLDGHVLVADGSQHYTAGELNIIDHRSYGIPTEWEHDFRGHLAPRQTSAGGQVVQAERRFTCRRGRSPSATRHGRVASSRTASSLRIAALQPSTMRPWPTL